MKDQVGEIPWGADLTRRAHFTDSPPPKVGEVTQGFGENQYRIIEVARWKDRWEVTETKLHPEDFVDDPDWVMRTPHE